MVVAQLPLGCVPLKLLPRVSSLRFPPRPTFPQSAKDVVASVRTAALFQIIPTIVYSILICQRPSLVLRFFVSSPYPRPSANNLCFASPVLSGCPNCLCKFNPHVHYTYIDGLLYKYYMSTFSAFEKKNPLNPFSVSFHFESVQPWVSAIIFQQ